ncbi:MAG: hypothetical protein ACO3Z6_12700 [Pseudomonadales bacterium]
MVERTCLLRHFDAVLLLFSLLSLSSVTPANVITLAFSDVTGGQTFLNKNVGYDWTFSFSDNPTFSTVRGSFSLKAGAQSTEDVMLAIYRVDTNVLLGSASLAVGSASSTNFQTYAFDVLSNFTFSSGVSYRLRLTSAANTGPETWYIKDPNALEATGSATISLAAAPIIFDPTNPPAAPAPSTGALLILGLAYLISSARKRLKTQGSRDCLPILR